VPAIKRRGKAGRKPKFDWGEVTLFVQRELNRKGDFGDPENAVDGWRSQADLEKLVGDHIKKFEKKPRPAGSTIRRHIVQDIAAWRRIKQSARN
jgi:hypothetical protein